MNQETEENPAAVEVMAKNERRAQEIFVRDCPLLKPSDFHPPQLRNDLRHLFATITEEENVYRFNAINQKLNKPT